MFNTLKTSFKAQFYSNADRMSDGISVVREDENCAKSSRIR